jgi:hypothetical protein
LKYYKNGGLDKLIEKLDAVFLKDKTMRAYDAFQKFYDFKRESGDTLETFSVKFEQLYSNLLEHDMKLPDGVMAFFLLNACNLPEEREKLARATTTDLTYDNMKKQIKKICGSFTGSKDGEAAVPPVKEECLYNRFSSSRERGRFRSGRGRDRSDRDRSDWKDMSGNREKPEGQVSRRNAGNERTSERSLVLEIGRILKVINSRSFTCDSVKHFAKDCAHKNSGEKKGIMKKDVQEINILLLNAVPDKRQKNLVIESLGKGVLDSGCTKTVSGEFWMEEFLSTLSAEDKSSVKEEDSKYTFRFGDGVECKATQRITLPVKIGNLKYRLTVEISQADIPLLLSKGAMKQMQMKLNFSTDTVMLKEEEIDLDCTSSGHY